MRMPATTVATASVRPSMERRVMLPHDKRANLKMA